MSRSTRNRSRLVQGLIQFLLVFVCVGATWATDIQISTDDRAIVADPAVARQSTGETFFVWTEGFVVGRRFDAMGNPIDAQPFQISMPSIGGEGNPDVAMNDNGQAVVVWQEFTASGQLDILARLYTFDGSSGPSEIFQVNVTELGQQQAPKVILDAAGNFTVIFQGLEMSHLGDALFMRRFDASGQPLSPEQHVSETVTSFQQDPMVAQGPDGQVAVGWIDSKAEFEFVPMFRLFEADGSPMGDSVIVNDEALTSALAISPQGNVLVVTRSSRVTGRLFNGMGLPLTETFFISEPGTIVGDVAVTALEAGGFHVVWEQRASTIDLDLYGRFIQENGSFQSPPSPVTATLQGNQSQPEPAMQGNKALVAFVGTTDSAGQGIFSTCFPAQACPEVFLDGFESGNTSAWSSAVP